MRNTKMFWGEWLAQPPPQTPPSSASSTLDLRCPFQMDWTPAVVRSASVSVTLCVVLNGCRASSGDDARTGEYHSTQRPAPRLLWRRRYRHHPTIHSIINIINIINSFSFSFISGAQCAGHSSRSTTEKHSIRQRRQSLQYFLDYQSGARFA